MATEEITVPPDATDDGSGYWYRRGYSDAHKAAQSAVARVFHAIKIETTNDSNGNPRRGWLIYAVNTYGSLVGFADEEYRGEGALKNAAAILAGHDMSGHEYGGRHASYDHNHGGVVANGPKGAVVIRTLAVLTVPGAEYRTAMRATRSLREATDWDSYTLF